MSNKSSFVYQLPTLRNIANIENLFSAWRKLEKEFSFYDVWYEEESFKLFKCNLREELIQLRTEILDGSYRLSPIRPIPFPKKGVENVRQSFRIAVRDQVAWVAVCNILGPFAETKMPAWSFGNRLYVPMWRETIDSSSEYEEPKHVWRNGKFLNSAYRVYLPWNRSWPRFRHLLTATLKKMAFVPLDYDEEDFLEGNLKLDSWLRLDYVKKGYFRSETSEDTQNDKIPDSPNNNKAKKKTHEVKDVYWASIDLTKFYPTIHCNILRDKLIKHCRVKSNAVKSLLHEMTSFTIDPTGYSEDELGTFELGDGKYLTFDGLPTGLLVGGWLANIYMLDIDMEMAKRLKSNKHIAHFRYVDDHTFVSDSAKELVHWIQQYVSVLKKNGLYINADKFQPKPGSESEAKSFASHFITEIWTEEFFNSTDNDEWENYKKAIGEIEETCKIDSRYPSPLMTQTLQKVSQLGKLDLDLLSEREKAMVIHDLKTLIVTDLPEEEIREDTRVSFASTLLQRLLRKRSSSYDKLAFLRHEWIVEIEKSDHKSPVPSILDIFDLSPSPKVRKNAWPKELSGVLEDLSKSIDRVLYAAEANETRTAETVFNLLTKAVKKVPEKVKIWIRLVEFCIQCLPDKLPLVFRELSNTRNRNLHNLGYIFIRSQLVALMAHELIKKSWNLFFLPPSNNQSIDVYELSESIKALTNYPEFKPKYFFEEKSLYLYAIAKQLASYVKRVRNNEASSFQVDGDEEQISTTVLWLMDSIPFKHKREFNIVRFFYPILSGISETNKYLKVIMEQIITSHAVYNDIESAEIDRLLRICESDELYRLWAWRNKTYSELVQGNVIILSSFIEGKFATLDDIKEIRLNEARGSELLMLRILSSVIKSIEENHDNAIRIDCHNIIISVEDILNSWKHRNLSEDINVKFNENIEIKDYDDSVTAINEINRLYRLGVMLYSMLSSDTNLLWLKVRPEYGYEWSPLIKNLAESGKISSFSERILSACLLPTTRELVNLNVTVENIRKVNSHFAPIFINNIKELKKKIDDYLSSMEYSLISLDDKKVVEVKVIDLE